MFFGGFAVFSVGKEGPKKSVCGFFNIFFFTIFPPPPHKLGMQNIFSCIEAIFITQERKYLIYNGNLKTIGVTSYLIPYACLLFCEHLKLYFF